MLKLIELNLSQTNFIVSYQYKSLDYIVLFNPVEGFNFYGNTGNYEETQ